MLMTVPRAPGDRGLAQRPKIFSRFSAQPASDLHRSPVSG